MVENKLSSRSWSVRWKKTAGRSTQLSPVKELIEMFELQERMLGIGSFVSVKYIKRSARF